MSARRAGGRDACYAGKEKRKRAEVRRVDVNDGQTQHSRNRGYHKKERKVPVEKLGRGWKQGQDAVKRQGKSASGRRKIRPPNWENKVRGKLGPAFLVV